ncbi:MAG: DUF5017 domain-containing protein [Niabella sp.]
MKYLYIVPVIIMISCTKQDHISVPSLDIAVNSHSYKVGDTVTFNILNTQADFLSFYSGESTSDYKFVKEEKKYNAITALSFWTAKYAGNNADCGRLMYSTNFSGVYDSTSIRSANWQDITDRFFMPPIGTSTYYYSNEVDISDLFIAADKPVYFAWFMNTRENSNRTLFKVQRFQIRGIVEEDSDFSRIKYDFAGSGFKMVLGRGWAGVTASLPVVNATDVFWNGPTPNTTYKEGWAVSAPIYPVEEVNLGAAKAVGLKALGEEMPSSYTHVYQRPGNYSVTFVAANSSIYGRKEIVKSINITIEE